MRSTEREFSPCSIPRLSCKNMVRLSTLHLESYPPPVLCIYPWLRLRTKPFDSQITRSKYFKRCPSIESVSYPS